MGAELSQFRVDQLPGLKGATFELGDAEPGKIGAATTCSGATAPPPATGRAPWQGKTSRMTLGHGEPARMMLSKLRSGFVRPAEVFG